MALHLKDLDPASQKRALKAMSKGQRGASRLSVDVVLRHAVAIAAELLDGRQLKTSDARRVLGRAVKILDGGRR